MIALESLFSMTANGFGLGEVPPRKNLNFSTNCPAAFCQTRVMG